MTSILLITAIVLLSEHPGWSVEVVWETHGPETRYGVTALTLDPGNPHLLFAGSDLGGLFKSTDGGASWHTVWAPAPDGSVSNHVSDIRIDPHHPEIVFVAVDSYVGSWQPGGVYRSDDGGVTWEPANDGLPGSAVSFLTVDPQESGVLYVGVSGQLFQSLDYGVTWQSSLSGEGIGVLAIDPQDSQILYAGGGGLYRSLDRGHSWIPSSQGLLLDEVYISSLAIAPTQAQILYAGGTPRGGPDFPGRIFKSVDGGMNWKEIAQLGTWLRTLVIDPAQTDMLYAGSSGKGGEIGTFVSSDGGNHWQRIHGGGAHELVIDPQNAGVVYAGMRTSARGVFRFTIEDRTVIEGTTWGLIKALFR